ncbi:MAG: chitobiase/beta-hexosaminidase C-terminal domain-containing protein [Bacteroidales bacterium]|nr:chitobiase/beta-hexosaminidase C-terminal domain-containing protein [Bacteroidales bacterium]
MKTILSTIMVMAAAAATTVEAQGWPENYGGVMLQGFYWDSYSATKWTKLEAQADEICNYFSLVWVPQSAYTGSSTSMGYDPLYYFDQHSSFGTEEQLRSFISTYKQKGTGIIADVVVNHRKNVSNWVDFPAETYNGVTYQMVSTDIVSNDDGGKTATWANQNGYSLSSNIDEGEGWDGMRDLDHKSQNVQKSVLAYTKYLVDDLGYTGFRYDMVKGFDGSHVADYNTNAGVQFSVGEYWDGTASKVYSWINSTKKNDVPQSAAFDFAFRYTCRDAVNNKNWANLKNTSGISDADYRRYSVTFVENHDTEYRSATASQDPIKGDTVALNAWMLAMPGTPCVFLKHWTDCKEEIKNLIEARRLVGIHNQSTYAEWMSGAAYIGRTVTGANGTLRVLCGSYQYNVAANYIQILSGKNYKYYVLNTLEAPWIGKGSGSYTEGETVTVPLIAISADANAKLVYTTDGTDPTATSTAVTSGTELTITSDAVLKVGLLSGGIVRNIQSRTFTFQAANTSEYYTATMHVCNQSGALNPLFAYVWAGPDNEQINGNWPGTKLTATITENNLTWYKQSFQIPKNEDYVVNFVFTTTGGGTQTVDVTGMKADVWYIINSTKSGNKYTVTDVTSQYSSLEAIFDEGNNGSFPVYDLQGRRVSEIKNGQLYLQNGKKILIR